VKAYRNCGGTVPLISIYALNTGEKLASQFNRFTSEEKARRIVIKASWILERSHVS
jgi:hypothetical protein